MTTKNIVYFSFSFSSSSYILQTKLNSSQFCIWVSLIWPENQPECRRFSFFMQSWPHGSGKKMAFFWAEKGVEEKERTRRELFQQGFLYILYLKFKFSQIKVRLRL